MNTSSRRRFLKNSFAASLAFTGLARCLASEQQYLTSPYGDLIKDPAGILDLPKGFHYHVISKEGNRMSDGLKVPARPDGMAAFAGKEGRVILVRNHELTRKDETRSAFDKASKISEDTINKAYDTSQGIASGGTTNIVYNPKTKKVEKEFLSLIGTDFNCSGGAMPWGSWITCEETLHLTSKYGKNHGYCFEVKATDDGKLQQAIPLKALGRFRHEAVALDPRTGILYLTEDIEDSLLYRFIPDIPEDFTSGKLQALALTEESSADLRNWKSRGKPFPQNQTKSARWIDLEDVESPKNDLRHRGFKSGAAIFARGEGITYANEHIYICCTNGGPKEQGQIFKLTPSVNEAAGDTLELFIQPTSSDLLTNGDNICNTPWGDLVICEDLTKPFKKNDVFIRGIKPDGSVYTIARNALNKSEFAGSCFSPDGTTLFVNIQLSGLTLAIEGPWQA
ncbi:MAG: alkaline phosphatase PhoX [Akkermansiaceae bacterium]